jgi:predicted metalloprotease with PDZ domain
LRKTAQEARTGRAAADWGEQDVSRSPWFAAPAISSLLLLHAGTLLGTPVQYTISLDHPERHLFHVRMTIPDVSGDVLLQMPAWNALYQIRDFSNHVERVEAHAGADEAPVEKIDKQTWRVRGNGGVTVEYSTYWDEAGPFAAQLNSEHAFINTAMILMYVPGRTQDAATLTLADIPDDWRVGSAAAFACGATSGKPACSGETTSYDAMVDAPIEVSKFKEFKVPGLSTNISVVVHGDNWSQKKIEDALSKICSYEIKLMDGAPFEHYTFIFHVGKGAGGGGMEHANSTAIGLPSDDYLANVSAHEFFHLWNVKRIRPATLEPVDFTKEQYTRALWFAEGVTSTYGSYTLLRSGIWNKERFYGDLTDQISELESRPANHWQSAEESSLDAWLEKYPLYNGRDYSVSYYTKGQVLGELLDLLIRDRTSNTKSLDDVLRGLNTDFAKQGKFYRDSLDIRLEAEKVAGGSFEEFFHDYVAEAKPLPYAQIFGLAGLELRTREAKAATLGFSPGRDASGGTTVRAVDGGSPAAEAGLRVGDVILSVNGADVPRSLSRWVRDRQPGEVVKLRIRRDEKELALECKLGEEREVHYEIVEDAHASEKAKRIHDGWLHGVTLSSDAH